MDTTESSVRYRGFYSANVRRLPLAVHTSYVVQLHSSANGTRDSQDRRKKLRQENLAESEGIKLLS